ncbi:uncharacterized protein [Temnothorax longispinosus]|uniref:uncharacterized protein isoform X1 n=2 Tax=Temnothorax longispinosus TaxID=300112 RepID=UPI003A998BCB
MRRFLFLINVRTNDSLYITTRTIECVLCEEASRIKKKLLRKKMSQSTQGDNSRKEGKNKMKGPLKKKDTTSVTSDVINSAGSSNKQEISILNRNNEMESISFASDEMLETIQLEDSTVEIVGFIDEIDGPKLVGKAQNYQLLKFILNNNSCHRIQVVVWNKEIERIKHHIKPNNIVHIDGAKAKKTKVPEFNQGTLPYELIIRSNTIINNLGTFDLKTVINAIKPQLVNLSDVFQHLNYCILVRGYIKTSLNICSNSFKTIGSGSVTDGTYKLEIQITDYKPEDNVDFEKGQEVEIKGFVKMSNDIFYLDVQRTSDIKLIGNETLSFAQLLQGTKPIMKRSMSDDMSGPLNKIVRE